MEQSKPCSKCSQLLPLSRYYSHKTNADGLFSWCKKCHAEINAKNRKPMLAKLALKQRLAYADNPAIFRERARQYRQANPEKTKQLFKEWSQANPAKARERGARRRARKANNGIYLITSKEKKRLYQSSCFYCGSNKQIQIDHVIPIARGGTHSIGNLVAACAKCNNHKRARFVMEWRFGMSGYRSRLEPIERGTND